MRWISELIPTQTKGKCENLGEEAAGRLHGRSIRMCGLRSDLSLVIILQLTEFLELFFWYNFRHLEFFFFLFFFLFYGGNRD
jgi:hypothetical protein